MKLDFIDLLSGQGGFADVWRAKDELGRELAVKIVRDASVGISNALQHARALARAKHPNVVTVHAFEKVLDPNGSGWVDAVVMELLPGETVGARLDGGAPLTRDVLASLGKGVIAAVTHIHSQGMVHGDLHEQNVMISNGEAKVIDLLHRYTLGPAEALKHEDQKRRELRALRALLQQLLNHSEIDASRCNEFTQEVRGELSLHQLTVAFEDATSVKSASRLRLEYSRTPLNLFDLVGPGLHRDYVRTLLGPPSFVEGLRWRYRYQETQVEICFAENEAVDAVVLALCNGKEYYGNHPIGHTDQPLGKLTLADVLDGGGQLEEVAYSESLRTREVFLRGRWGPPGAWSYYACGALTVLSGVGHLAEVSFEWDRDKDRLATAPKKILVNWLASTTTDNRPPPGFDWFIR